MEVEERPVRESAFTISPPLLILRRRNRIRGSRNRYFVLVGMGSGAGRPPEMVPGGFLFGA